MPTGTGRLTQIGRPVLYFVLKASLRCPQVTFWNVEFLTEGAKATWDI